jgi:hypothetical protein
MFRGFTHGVFFGFAFASGLVKGFYFGLFLSLSIGTVQKLTTRKMGAGDDVSPRQTKTVNLDMSLDAAIDRCREALGNIGAKIISEKKEKERIEAKMSISWKSAGEIILIELSDLGTGQIRVQISSSPLLLFKFTFLDFGKGYENVERIISLLGPVASAGASGSVRELERHRIVYSAVNEFRVGNVLVRGFQILIRNIVPFGLLSLLLMSPPHIYGIIAVHSWGGVVGSLLLLFVLSQLLIAALVYGIVSELRGRHASLGNSISWGLSLIFPVIGVAILVGLALVLPVLVSVPLFGLVGSPERIFLIFVLPIPGFIVAAILLTVLWVAVPVAVIERSGVIASLGRSTELAKGYRWQIFAIVVILLVLAAVVTVLLKRFVVYVIPTTTAFVLLNLVLVLVSLVVTAFFGALWAVISAVGYHDLRVAKEGIDDED